MSRVLSVKRREKIKADPDFRRCCWKSGIQPTPEEHKLWEKKTGTAYEYFVKRYYY